MGRLQRKYSTTGFYHIMLRGNERKRIFLDDEDRHQFIDTLAKKEADTDLSVYAYCLMDNHVHMVLRDDKNEISSIMKGIATSYAMFFNNKYQRVGHVFQGRFKSEAIEDERYLMATIRYVHNNPVQAGLVEQPIQYKWSSYDYYVNPKKTERKLVDSEFILEMISTDLPKAIQEFELFSRAKGDAEFMDKDEGIARTLEEGQECLNKYLKKTWPGASKEDIIKDTIKLNTVIMEMRTNTRLSIRKIAELLGVNRGMVERVRPGS